MVKVYKREYFYGRAPTWTPLLDENGRPVTVATQEAAKEFIAGLRGGIYYLQNGEYAAPDYGAAGPDGRIYWVDP